MLPQPPDSGACKRRQREPPAAESKDSAKIQEQPSRAAPWRGVRLQTRGDTGPGTGGGSLDSLQPRTRLGATSGSGSRTSPALSPGRQVAEAGFQGRGRG